MLAKLLIFCAAVLLIADVNAALLCEFQLTSPDTCSSSTYNTNVNSNIVYGCSGGSSVTEFEVWGGCGPNVYNGGWGTIETPSGVQLPSNQAGRYCYCQIKSINGGPDVASSPQWVFLDAVAGYAPVCASDCAYFCAHGALSSSGFRAALFQALQ